VEEARLRISGRTVQKLLNGHFRTYRPELVNREIYDMCWRKVFWDGGAPEILAEIASRNV